MVFNSLSVSIILAPNGKRQKPKASLYVMQRRCTGKEEKKEVEQKGNDVQLNSLWLLLVFHSHSYKDCLCYGKVKDAVISFLCAAYPTVSLISRQVLRGKKKERIRL